MSMKITKMFYVSTVPNNKGPSNFNQAEISLMAGAGASLTLISILARTHPRGWKVPGMIMTILTLGWTATTNAGVHFTRHLTTFSHDLERSGLKVQNRVRIAGINLKVKQSKNSTKFSGQTF